MNERKIATRTRRSITVPSEAARGHVRTGREGDTGPGVESQARRRSERHASQSPRPCNPRTREGTGTTLENTARGGSCRREGAGGPREQALRVQRVLRIRRVTELRYSVSRVV